MSDIAVLEAPAAAPVASARLVQPREQALIHLQNHLSKAAQIKALRIRTGAELDQARAAKLEWTTRGTELLKELFDSAVIADQCNDWVGRIYPEYAEFGNFVEQFYAEMDHRMARLKEVIKKIEQMGEPRAARTVAPAAAPVVAPAPVSKPPAGPVALAAVAGVLIVHNSNEAHRQALAEFLESLDIDISVVQEMTDLANILERNRAIGFAVVLGEANVGHDFELGFCAARVGLNRVILLSEQAAGAPQAGARGLTQIALDAAGAWQLLLAKQLKRAGLPIDLNRLC